MLKLAFVPNGDDVPFENQGSTYKEVANILQKLLKKESVFKELLSISRGNMSRSIQ